MLDRYLNVLPTVTIREGSRIKVYLTNDLHLPAYETRGRRRWAMKRRFFGIAAILAITTIWTSTARAQLVVFDPTNYVQAIAQVQQLIRQYQFWSSRYGECRWTSPAGIARSRWRGTPTLSRPGRCTPQQILRALNSGDVAGSAYRALVDPLDLPTDIIGRLPPLSSRRLTGRYGAIELQDSITRLAIDQTGSARTAGTLHPSSGP